MSPILKQTDDDCDDGGDRRGLAAPSWPDPHTAGMLRRCWNSPESFLLSPCSTSKSGSAGLHKQAGS